MADETFHNEMKIKIAELIHDNPDTEPGLVWDTVKAGIRGTAIEFLARDKSNRKQQIATAENKLRVATHARDAAAAVCNHSREVFYAEQVVFLQIELESVQEKLNFKRTQYSAAQAHYESNQCTKDYFKQPGHSNDAVKALHDLQGNLITNESKVLKECRDYYHKLYQQPPIFQDLRTKEKFLSHIPGNLLSALGSVLLEKDISIQELHEALKSMRKNAVPGEDGFTVNFYLTYWDDIKQLLYDSYIDAFYCGHLLITQRHGMIRLIPKKDKNLLLVPSWRPITLLNVDYKILTKLFVKRLSQFLPDLIKDDQRGFIKHRSIQENLLDVQALIVAFNNDSEEGMLILLDIQKAFDTLGWNFLRSVLVKYNFPESFLRWFDIFYMGKELHILNNGLISEVVFPSRGVAQGCGISPLFFCLSH